MNRLFQSAVLLLCSVSFAFGQLTVVSTSPANGTASVPVWTTLSITFSEELDTSVRYERMPVLILTTGDYNPDQIYSVSADLRTIQFPVILPANSDCVILVMAARSSSGQALQHPYPLNFTTLGTFGTLSISGGMSFPGGDPLNSVVVLHNSGNDQPVSVAVCNPGQSSYSLIGARPGFTYTVAAAKDVNGDGSLGGDCEDASGSYDSDGDGIADVIVMGNTSVNNIDITLVLQSPITVLPRLSAVEAAAIAFDPGAVVKGAWGYESVMPPTGQDCGWGYDVYSPRLGRLISIWASSSSTDVDSTVENDFPWGPQAFPHNCIDSDSAMRTVERAGGAHYRSVHPTSSVEMWGGNANIAGHQFLWMFNYNPDDDTVSIFEAGIDMLTGEIIWITDDADPQHGAVSADFSLEQNYPNPFNPVTSITYALPRATRVSVTVFNLLGQEVASVVDEMQTAGSHTVSFDGSHLSSGVYLYSLKAGEFAQTKKMVLLK